MLSPVLTALLVRAAASVVMAPLLGRLLRVVPAEAEAADDRRCS